jgi:competence protein ComGC
MKIHSPHRQRAFTLLEGLVVGAVVLLLLAIFLPALAASKRKSSKLGCNNSLKEVGIAFRIWEEDNGDKYPMAVPAALGGAQELIATGNVTACFQVMSNELANPRTLICPNDTHHTYATNFENLGHSNVSYFIGMDAVETDPQSLLSGDANLVWDGHPVFAEILNLRTNTATWTRERHDRWGYVLLGDGSVQTIRKIGFTSSAGTYMATNSIVVP